MPTRQQEAVNEGLAALRMYGVGMLPPMGREEPVPVDARIEEAYRDAGALPYSPRPDSLQRDPRDESGVLPPLFRRNVTDDEYDQMVRHDHLLRRLQSLEAGNPSAYRYRSTRPDLPYAADLRGMEAPPVRYRPVNPLTYPGNPIKEGIEFWDTTISLPVNAARMVYGAEDAADRFATAANSALLGIPEFIRDGSFSPARDNAEAAYGRVRFDNPLMFMAGNRADNLVEPPTDPSGMTGSLEVMADFGIPENIATRGLSVVLDNAIDPDGGSVRAIRSLLRGRLAQSLGGMASDNAIGGPLWAVTEAARMPFEKKETNPEY